MAAPGTSSAVLPFLSGLPSFGTLIGDRLIAPEVATIHYVPSKDTSPPQDQVLHADTQNALVRALAAKRLRDEKREKKRQADEAVAERPTAKRVAAGSTVDASSLLAAELRGLTVPQLKHRLQALGLPVSGKKEELVDRLVAAQQRSAAAGSGGGAAAPERSH